MSAARAIANKRAGTLIDCSAPAGRDYLLSIQAREVRAAFFAAGAGDQDDWLAFYGELKKQSSYSVRLDRRWIVKNRQVQPSAARARKR